jgi:hypothetical protein
MHGEEAAKKTKTPRCPSTPGAKSSTRIWLYAALKPAASEENGRLHIGPALVFNLK